MFSRSECRVLWLLILNLYSVGRVLSTYRSGKLPKAFKIIPTLKNWEEASPAPPIHVPLISHRYYS